MSFEDCIRAARDDGHITAERHSTAQSLYDELRGRYARQGRPADVADALAAEDVKLAMAKEAGDKRHTYLANLQVMRKLEAEVANSPDIATLGTSKIEYMDHRANKGATLVGQANGLRRLFNGMMGDFFKETRRGLVVRSLNPMRQENMVRELFGEATGDAQAKAYAKRFHETSVEIRRMANEAGALYGHLEDWHMPQRHNSMAITKAGFDRWFDEIDGRIDWAKIENHRTGKPMARDGMEPDLATRQEFLREVYDNIVFGKESKEAVYGRPKGHSIPKKSAQHRVLHFKSADDWMAYDKGFGGGGILSAVSHHFSKMADEIVLLRSEPRRRSGWITSASLPRRRRAAMRSCWTRCAAISPMRKRCWR